MRRATLTRPTAVISGDGVRSGCRVSVRLLPAESGEGLAVLRADLGLGVPLHLAHAPDIPHCTAVGLGEESITLYVEHVMAALHSYRVTDAVIELDGPEVPLLDGSALPWCELIESIGVRELPEELEPLIVTEALTVGEGDQSLTALPPEREGQAVFAYALEYTHPLIGRQAAAFELGGAEDFAETIAPARTFAMAEEIAQAQAAGVLKGGSEENCLVVYRDHYSAAPALPEAFARHKVLDMIGDLYLLGRPVWGRFEGRRTGHRHNREVLRRIAACGIV